MKVDVTFLGMGMTPPRQLPGFIESDHVSAVEVHDAYFFIFLLSGQQLHILPDRSVYNELTA